MADKFHLFNEQAMALAGDREGLLSVCAGPLPPFKDFLRTKIRSGDKTETRRIPKEQPLPWANRFEPAPFEGYGKIGGWIQMKDDATGQRGYLNSPYGLAGQVRYLREPLFRVGKKSKYAYYKDGDGSSDFEGLVKDSLRFPVEWRWKRDTLPQIFMPKEYARTFVYMSAIRIERLHDIDEAGAVAEGCRGRTVGDGEVVGTARADFVRLWCGINGKGSWALNPWVWVLEFSVIGGSK